MNKNLVRNNQKGQLGVFVGMSILIIISLLAFVINVGLFVKAKINLQNAVDAAAYAGAATQARRLTNIGHLNWEMRNIMKEWMFKYYVLGNMGNSKVRNVPGSSPMDFRPQPFSATAAANPNAFAKFNVPRVCINFGSTHNICNVYGVPGVPRFPSIGSPGPSAITSAFTDQAVSIKSRNCVDRSVLNFSTTLLWTFGKGGASAGLADAPRLLGHRVGAWPQALEYAIRMRNLEYIVNRPPVEQGICISEGSDCISLTELRSAAGNTPLNERPIAAFESGYRNLGGGSSAANSGADHLSIKNTFKLTEIPPVGRGFTAGSGLGGFLIPGGREFPGTGVAYSQKHYLDLSVIPINYVMFFTTFVPSDGNFSTDIQSEGACSSSITGIPVPYYITGFYKNPDVLTYYAVKGEAKYMGLFFPFNKNEGLTLRAYAAAKPMGGRIGPILFEIEDNKKISGRSDDDTRSVGFLSGISMNGTWSAGMPIPFDPTGDFYINSEDDAVGGIPEAGEEPVFSLPNMIYDYIPGVTTLGSAKIEIVQQAANIPTPTALKGLYESDQFNLLKSNLTTSNPTSEQIEAKVIEAKRATLFDAMNYLIPTHDNESTNNEAPSIVQGETQSIGGVQYKRYALYAPLCSDDSTLLYDCDGSQLGTTIISFLRESKSGANLYLDMLKDVADGLRNQASTSGSASNYVQAANSLYPAPSLGLTLNAENPPQTTVTPDCRTSASLAEKFQIFFSLGVDPDGGLNSPPTICGVTPLLHLATNYIDGQNKNSRDFIQPEYYISGSSPLPDKLQSAFSPTKRRGATSDGGISHPFLGAQEGSGQRNFYSTKLFSIKKVINKADPVSYNDLFSYAEKYTGGTLRSGADEKIVGGDSNIKNILDAKVLEDFGKFKDAF